MLIHGLIKNASNSNALKISFIIKQIIILQFALIFMNAILDVAKLRTNKANW